MNSTETTRKRWSRFRLTSTPMVSKSEASMTNRRRKEDTTALDIATETETLAAINLVITERSTRRSGRRSANTYSSLPSSLSSSLSSSNNSSAEENNVEERE